MSDEPWKFFGNTVMESSFLNHNAEHRIPQSTRIVFEAKQVFTSIQIRPKGFRHRS